MSKKVNEKAKYTFTGCMFLGMGIGYYLGHFIVGMFAGMGVGFFSMLIFKDQLLKLYVLSVSVCDAINGFNNY